MAKFLNTNFKWLLLAAAAAYFYRKTDAAVKTLTRPVAAALAEVQFAINGSNYIKYPNPGFYLNPDKLDSDQRVRDKTWLKAMYMTHDDHGDYIEQIFDASLQLKAPYIPLVGGVVDAASIVTALKG
ncbi:hypothetical protein [Pseudoalteromonas prydzensis]|uniref:hypothetical protein n=1 Tax=Pseudoalteromonas prydzensis TaxID=182141 RepID=UPI0007E51E52|nr:hypothetical protein [Pseudoalteromonas prydzensis]MBE0378997.1 hypothetical protein [Pseudoalteromonas prydzensis ACAM 620]